MQAPWAGSCLQPGGWPCSRWRTSQFPSTQNMDRPQKCRSRRPPLGSSMVLCTQQKDFSQAVHLTLLPALSTTNRWPQLGQDSSGKKAFCTKASSSLLRAQETPGWACACASPLQPSVQTVREHPGHSCATISSTGDSTLHFLQAYIGAWWWLLRRLYLEAPFFSLYDMAIAGCSFVAWGHSGVN